MVVILAYVIMHGRQVVNCSQLWFCTAALASVGVAGVACGQLGAAGVCVVLQQRGAWRGQAQPANQSLTATGCVRRSVVIIIGTSHSFILYTHNKGDRGAHAVVCRN